MTHTIVAKEQCLIRLKPDLQVSVRHVCLCVSCKLTIIVRIKYSVVLG